MISQVRRTLLLSTFVTLPNLATGEWWSPPDWPGVKRDIRQQYPQVKQMSAGELQLALNQPTPPLLLDVRDSKEFAVSHLLHAQLAPDWQHALAILQNQAKSRAIVLYCAVGWRSSSVAQQLMENGYSQVFNLEGSLFEWANQGLPVYRGSQRAYQVHPYDRRWGILLNRNLHASMP